MKIIKINESNLTQKYNSEIFLAADASFEPFISHKEIARKLRNKKPYTITIILDNLDPELWNNKIYVEKTKVLIQPLYKDILFEYFFNEFGRDEGNTLYAKWLDKYRPLQKKGKIKMELDEYIIRNELEPRYKSKILKRYKNCDKLFKPRVRIDRKRYYNLPFPLNYVDWRNPYDNIFIWEDRGKKFFRKGGSGSSGGRETNSKFIYGFSLINKKRPIKSYLFLYSDDNQLYFVKEFASLTVPRYDIGLNYHLVSVAEKRILSETNFIEWENSNKLREVKIIERKK